MAGGIDWFRWHHGSVTDPKFQLVARKARASLPDVLAVWAYVLEKASAAAERGVFGQIDAEALDCLFGFPDTETRTADILNALAARGLIADGRVTAWECRQPKRERDPAPLPADAPAPLTSTERSRIHRAKRNHAEPDAAMQRHAEPDEAVQRHATPCNASNGQATPREEERREEEKREEPSSLRSEENPPKPPRKRRGAAAALQVVSAEQLVEEGVLPQHATDWLAVRQKKDLPLTPTAWEEVKVQAEKAGMTAAEAVRTAAANAWGGFKHSWLHEGPAGSSRAPPHPAMNKQEALEQSNRQVAAAWAAKMAGGQQ